MGDGADLRSEEDFRKAHNAERDLHRTFKRAGLSLPIPIRSMDHTLPDGKQIQIDYVQPSDWLSCLIKRYPALLAGGRAKLTDQLRGFWDLYSFQHGDHAVFKHHANDLERVFPLQFWGDEGRGPKRAGWLAGTIESCLGLDDIKWKCCCERKLDDLPRSWLPTFDGNVAQDNQYIRAISNVGTNYKGHSFLTRYLLFGIPGYLYGSKSDLVWSHLNKAAEDLTSLFNVGIVVDGQRWFAALVGSKGDLKFQATVVAVMNRSFQNMGSVRQIACCSLCLAGTESYPMEDVAHEAGWVESLYQERPWDENHEPPFSQVPFDDGKPELLYRLDVFHVFKVGVGRDLGGSGLVWLCYLGIFDYDEGESKSVDARLTRAHSWFVLWTRAEKKYPGLRSFTKSYFNIPNASSSAWTNSKGSDTMLILQFLQWMLTLQLQNLPEPLMEHQEMLRLLLRVITSSLDMCEIGYTHPLWIPRACAMRQYLLIMVVVRGYKKLAAYFVERGMAGFRIKPKLHALHHLAYDLRLALKTNAPRVLNWACFGCEMNEDHIGHTARLSRKLATKTLSLRLMQRYFLKTKALIRRHFINRNKKAS